MTPTNPSDRVRELVQRLRCKNDDWRYRVTLELRRYIHIDLKEEIPFIFNRGLEQLEHECSTLLQSNDLNDRKAAMLGIACLMELDSLSVHNAFVKFEKPLRDLNVSQDLTTNVMHARLLALFGVISTQDFVTQQMKSACDRLTDDASSEHMKAFATLCLREIALHTPNSFYKNLSNFTDAICIGLRDKYVLIRDLCALTLRVAFSVIAEREVGGRRRERSTMTSYYVDFFEEIVREFRAPGSNSNTANAPITSLTDTSRASQILGGDGMFNEPHFPSESPAFPSRSAPQSATIELIRKRKLTLEDKAHGFLIVLHELLLLANKNYEQIRRDMDTLAGEPQSHFSSQSEAIRVVTYVRWPLTQNEDSLFKQRAELFNSPACSMLLQQKYDQICLLVYHCMQVKRSVLLPPLLLQVIPRLAALNVTVFQASRYLGLAMEYFAQCLQNSRERPLVFQAVGYMAYWVKDGITEGQYVQRWLELVQQNLPTKDTKKRLPPLEVSLLMCISLFAKAYNESIYERVNAALDNMLVTGLSQPLTECLKVIAFCIPRLKKRIHEGLLNSITMVLDGRSQVHHYHHHHSKTPSGSGGGGGLVSVLGGLGSGLHNWMGNATSNSSSTSSSSPVGVGAGSGGGVGSGPGGALLYIPLTGLACAALFMGFNLANSVTPTTYTPVFTSTGATSTSVLASSVSSSALTAGNAPPFTAEHAAICQALRTLGNFHFESSTNNLIRHTADRYINHEVKEIRLEAIRCLSHLMMPLLKVAPTFYEAGPTSQNIVAEILTKLLMAATSDPEPEVRLCVLQSLTSKFDPHIAQANHLDSLFLILQDEVFETRELALRILGRLSILNPACVQPSLRRVFLQILAEMEYSGTAHHRDQAARILATLISAAPRFIRPYAEPLMLSLLPTILPIMAAQVTPATGAQHSTNMKMIMAATGNAFPSTGLPLMNATGPSRAHALMGSGHLPVGLMWNAFTSTNSAIMLDAVNRETGRGDEQQEAANSRAIPGADSMNGPLVMGRAPPPDSVLVNIIRAVGEVAKVAGGPLKKHLPQLMPILYIMLQDANSYNKRKMAIHVLCLLVTNTGFVVKPYEENPELLRHLLQMLKTEEAKSIRSDVIRALGLFGALDPLKYKIYSGIVDCVSDTSLAVSVHEVVARKDVEMSQSELLVSGHWQQTEEYFAASALSALLGVLREPSLRNQYVNAVGAIIQVLATLGRNTVPYLKQVMPDYLRCMRESSDAQLTAYMLHQMNMVILTAKIHIQEFMPSIVNIMLIHWEKSAAMRYLCTELLDSMIVALRTELKPHLTRFLPVLLRQLAALECDHARLKLLDIIPDLGYCLEEYLHMFVPAITRLLDHESSLISTGGSGAVTIAQSTSFAGSGSSAGTSSSVRMSALASAMVGDASGGAGNVSLTFLAGNQLSTPVAPHAILLSALECLARLADTQHGMEDYAGRVVQPVCRLLDKSGVTLELQQAAMDLLTSLMAHTGQKFQILLPLVLRTLQRTKIQHSKFNNALSKVSKGTLLRLPEDELSLYKSRATLQRETRASNESVSDLDTQQQQQANSQSPQPGGSSYSILNLERSWQTNKIASRDDWLEWLKTFSNALVRNSPNAAIRACTVLCEVTPSVTKTLFNAAFVSCWPQLLPQQQDELINALETVLQQCELTEVTQAILNLAEFTTHFDKAKLPIRSHLLAERAMFNRAYAKALYYKEKEFLEQVKTSGSPTQETMSSLLTINNKLQLQESSSAVLLYATKCKEKLQNEAQWYEKLHDYNRARHLYELKLEEDRNHDHYKQLTLGRMRCLKALGEWSMLNQICAERWRSSAQEMDDPTREKLAQLGAHSAWATNEWERMRNYTHAIPRDSYEGAYLRAVLEVHDCKYETAINWMERARDMLDADLTAMAGESYYRAYDDLVCAQKLAELEEVVQYKLVPNQHEILRQSWYDRLLGCQSVVEDWHNLLKIRQLVISPQEDVKPWLRFAGLCRRSDRMGICHNVLTSLLSYNYEDCPVDNPIPAHHPQIVVSLCKYLWAKNERKEAIQRLSVHIEHILKPELAQLESPNFVGCTSKEIAERKVLLAKSCLKLGQWFTELRLRTTTSHVASGQMGPVILSTLPDGSDGDSANRGGGFIRSKPMLITSTSGTALNTAQQHMNKSLTLLQEHGLACTATTLTLEHWNRRQDYVTCCYRTATEQAPGMHKAWQFWALANYTVIHQHKAHLQNLIAREQELQINITQTSNLLAAATSPGAGGRGVSPLSPDPGYSSVTPPQGVTTAGFPMAAPPPPPPPPPPMMPHPAQQPNYRHQLLHPQQQQLMMTNNATGGVMLPVSHPGPASLPRGTTFGQAAGVSLSKVDASMLHHPPEQPTAVANMDLVLHIGEHGSGDVAFPSTGPATNSSTDSSSTQPPPQSLPPPMQVQVQEALSKLSKLQVELERTVLQKQELQRSMEGRSIPAVRGFVNAISLSNRANLQDSLRLITLLFEFGHMPEIREVIREGLHKIPLENWLLVIQQLLARIDTTKEHVAGMIVDLLMAVGKKHPQAMINPLVLSFKSGGSDRRRYNANKILYSMEEHSPRLVAEGFMLNEEMIRLAITWMEMWYECLEDACRVYIIEQNIPKMVKLLHPLHLIMKRGPETLNETSFHQEYMADLTNAQQWSLRYLRTGNQKDMHQSWETYYSIFKKLPRQVNNVSMLELTCASPRLSSYGSDWVLAIPGSYEPFKPVVTITGLNNTINFITSKQKPRKVSFTGSNGFNYVFLLKGHEDIRQDERVMQFFGLANSLLLGNAETLRRNLTIQRMSVIPLSTNTGLIGWVPNSDTLHSLIREYRDKNNIILNQEHRAMMKAAPDYEKLNLMQRTEVFELGLCETDGRDLANILWTKSPNSEAWLEHRTNFIRSMATMSMVGYILGLGDRHPSNLMLSRDSGKVIHIDFGDCFEVAMIREKYPEKVPFRLTRMIINAMEVTGIDGLFRYTCEKVMNLMRANSDSLLAVLEAFIHDPLLQWVLLENRKDVNDRKMLMHRQQQLHQHQQPGGLAHPQLQVLPLQPGHGPGGAAQQILPLPGPPGGQPGAPLGMNQQQYAAHMAAHQHALLQQQQQNQLGNGGLGPQYVGHVAPHPQVHPQTQALPQQLPQATGGGGGRVQQMVHHPVLAPPGVDQLQQQQQQHSHLLNAHLTSEMTMVAQQHGCPPGGNNNYVPAPPPAAAALQQRRAPMLAPTGMPPGPNAGVNPVTQVAPPTRTGPTLRPPMPLGGVAPQQQQVGHPHLRVAALPQHPQQTHGMLQPGQVGGGTGTGGGGLPAAVNTRQQHQPPQTHHGAHHHYQGGAAVTEDGNTFLFIDSASLRDSRNVNPWRHHLCNGPWLGCYAIAKKMRKQRENGSIVVERDGLQGFIFSAKPPSDDRANGESERDEGSPINTRARDVMTRISNKLNGQEMWGTEMEPLSVPQQVERLIQQATSNINLCQMYIGWCPFW